MSEKFPIIAIVGRPNVGKSTLFNRILGERRAIVEDRPGVTRDRNYALVEKFSVPFLLVDTGGFEESPDDLLGKEVVEQTLIAAEEADAIIALFDAASGCMEGDVEVVNMLRRYAKPVTFVANKCDADDWLPRAAEFYQLGVDEVNDISALHGRNVEEVVEKVLLRLPDYQVLLKAAELVRENEQIASEEASRISAFETEKEEELTEEELLLMGEPAEVPERELEPVFAPVFHPDESEESDERKYDREYRLRERSFELEEEEEEGGEGEEVEEVAVIPTIDTIRMAIIGRPNVGKSTLLNTLLGERRAITSDISGTTRDRLDSVIVRDGQEYVLMDTAGLRRSAKVDDAVERYSALRAMGAIAECHVAVIVLDAVEGPTEQDAKIAGLAHERGAGLLIVVNKWDLVEKNHRTVKAYTDNVREVFKFAPYAPIIYVSAQSGRRCVRVLEATKRAAEEGAKKIGTGRLNRVLKNALKRFTPPPYRGRPIKLFYAVQSDTQPPRFALFFNYPRALHFSHLRYLKNALREEFGFDGTDIKLVARKKS